MISNFDVCPSLAGADIPSVQRADAIDEGEGDSDQDMDFDAILESCNGGQLEVPVVNRVVSECRAGIDASMQMCSGKCILGAVARRTNLQQEPGHFKFKFNPITISALIHATFRPILNRWNLQSSASFPLCSPPA